MRRSSNRICFTVPSFPTPSRISLHYSLFTIHSFPPPPSPALLLNFPVSRQRVMRLFALPAPLLLYCPLSTVSRQRVAPFGTFRHLSRPFGVPFSSYLVYTMLW